MDDTIGEKYKSKILTKVNAINAINTMAGDNADKCVLMTNACFVKASSSALTLVPNCIHKCKYRVLMKIIKDDDAALDPANKKAMVYRDCRNPTIVRIGDHRPRGYTAANCQTLQMAKSKALIQGKILFAFFNERLHHDHTMTPADFKIKSGNCYIDSYIKLQNFAGVYNDQFTYKAIANDTVLKYELICQDVMETATCKTTVNAKEQDCTKKFGSTEKDVARDVDTSLGPIYNEATQKWAMCNMGSTEIDRTLTYAKFKHEYKVSQHVWMGDYTDAANIDSITDTKRNTFAQNILYELLHDGDAYTASGVSNNREKFFSHEYRYYGLSCAFRNKNTYLQGAANEKIPAENGTKIVCVFLLVSAGPWHNAKLEQINSHQKRHIDEEFLKEVNYLAVPDNVGKYHVEMDSPWELKHLFSTRNYIRTWEPKK